MQYFIHNTLKNRRFGISLIIFACVALFAYKTATAQQVLQRIEALVNDKIISGFDLRQRLALVLASTGGVENQEQYKRVEEQVLEILVDEQLQLQEAERFEVEITEQELEEYFVALAQQQGQTPEEFEAFLENANTSKSSLLNQVRAQIAWQRIVEGRLGQQVVITDEDVEARIARVEANAGKFEYRVSEIYLIVDTPSRGAQVFESAQRLKAQIDQGAPFFALAEQFSQAASAARGGDMGWVSEGQISTEVENAIAQLEVGQVSEPIRTSGGYYILALTDRRKILSQDPLDAVIDLWQFFKPFDATTTQEVAEAWFENAEQVIATINSCEQKDDMRARLSEDTTYDQIGQLPLRQLNPEIRNVLATLDVGQPSEPALVQDGAVIFLICSKTQPEVQRPTFDQVYNQLEQQRLAMMARRYLRDLRRDAIIDYK